MKMIKIIAISMVLTIVILFITFIIGLRIYDGDFFFLAPGYEKMDRFLKTNIDELSYVANELFELDYDSIEIRREPLHEEDKYNMRVSREYLVYETIPIPGELVEHIQNLYENGVEVISCGRDSIGFCLWSIMDESRDITYSRIGQEPESIQLIEVRELSIKNWYYEVHNFEKAKALNPQLFT